MRTLYESILDDEDVLINDVKKSINDPFAVLYLMLKEDRDSFEILETIQDGILDKFIEKKLFLDPKELEVNVVKRNLVSKIKFSTKDEYDPVFCLMYFPDLPNDFNIYIFSKECMENDMIYKISGNKEIETFPWLKTKFYKQYSKVCSNIKKEGFKKISKRIDRQYNAFVRNMN